MKFRIVKCGDFYIVKQWHFSLLNIGWMLVKNVWGIPPSYKSIGEAEAAIYDLVKRNTSIIVKEVRV
jgi:hypothetical protein